MKRAAVILADVILAAVILATGTLCVQICAQIGHPGVNADSVVIQDFERRVAAYLQLRKSVESNLPKLKATSSQKKILHHQDQVDRAIRHARKDARLGDIFTPEIAAEIRRLIAAVMQPDGPRIRRSLRSAEPVELHLRINENYPDNVPLQTTPPSLLANLPALPPEMEYRITGQDLVLLDVKANLIVDLIRGVFS